MNEDSEKICGYINGNSKWAASDLQSISVWTTDGTKIDLGNGNITTNTGSWTIDTPYITTTPTTEIRGGKGNPVIFNGNLGSIGNISVADYAEHFAKLAEAMGVQADTEEDDDTLKVYDLKVSEIREKHITILAKSKEEAKRLADKQLVNGDITFEEDDIIDRDITV